MTRRRRLLGWLVVAFMVVQVGVPLVELAAPRPARWGWQMFTAYAPAPEVAVERADGSVEPIDIDRLLVHPRPETDIAPALATAICASEDAAAVLVRTVAAGTSRIPCP